jgi:LacI family transcriptional regulator
MENKKVNGIRDLAEILGLSVTTVSRVLNNKTEKYRIGEATKQRVIKAANEYNYIPNKLARGLKLERTDTLGLIIPDISNPFFADIAQSIERQARAKGYSLILCDSGDDANVEKDLINLLISHRVEGIIIAPVGTEFETIKQTHRSGMPIVVIDRCPPEIGLPYITSDNYQGGYDAVNYLISMGHHKIACIQGIPKSQPTIDRVRGYKDALISNNLTVDPGMIVGDDYSTENGYMQTRILFSMDDPPTAIFALSNMISLGVIKATSEMGLKIPDNISLISFDEQPYSAFFGTPMTTVDQKKSEMGQLATDILLKFIANEEYRKKTLNMTLKTNLIIRDSVKKIS